MLFPLYLQNLRGLSTLQTGLLAPGIGRAYDRVGPRPLALPGTVLMAGVLLALGRINTGTPVWALLALHLTLSAGLALLFTPVFTSALSALSSPLCSHGSAILNTMQQVAGAAGVALLIALMAGQAATLGAGGTPAAVQVGGLHLAFSVAWLVALIAVGLAFFLRAAPQPAQVEVRELSGQPGD